ncbi:hypothetical protein ACMFMG_004408 [Clarireedia jacksonii]
MYHHHSSRRRSYCLTYLLAIWLHAPPLITYLTAPKSIDITANHPQISTKQSPIEKPTTPPPTTEDIATRHILHRLRPIDSRSLIDQTKDGPYAKDKLDNRPIGALLVEHANGKLLQWEGSPALSTQF